MDRRDRQPDPFDIGRNGTEPHPVAPGAGLEGAELLGAEGEGLPDGAEEPLLLLKGVY